MFRRDLPQGQTWNFSELQFEFYFENFPPRRQLYAAAQPDIVVIAEAIKSE